MERRLIYKVILILAVVATCVYFAFPVNKRINLGLDLQGGMHIVLRIDTANLTRDAREDAVERALEIIRNRIDEFGVGEPSILRQGAEEIVVQLPGVTDRDRAIDLIGKTALLEFKLVSGDTEKLSQAISGDIPEGYQLKYSQEDREPLLLEEESVLTGDALKTAMLRFDQSRFNEPIVGLELNPEGAKRFSEITSRNIGRRLAIVLDGKVQSAPRIREHIPTGEAVISGNFSVESASDLAIVLRAGALPAPMYIEEERTVGALLGEDSINQGIRAMVIGGTLLFLFMLVYYLFAGFVADIALGLNLVMILGGLGMLPVLFPGISATLTLPGIAGIALSLGMAVDANVLINERIREEVASGKPLRTAVNNGYHKAFSAIVDSNLTTLIAAFLLFQFGTGPIRGFAVTLTIGLIASMFTAIVVTRTIFELLIEFKCLKSIPMLQLFKPTKIDFIGKKRIFFALSVLVIGWGLFSFLSQGKSAYGIDFAGGQSHEYSFAQVMNIEDIRQALRDKGITDASIQQFKDNSRHILIKTPESEQKEDIGMLLKSAFPEQEIEILKIERVGPVAGRHLQVRAIMAMTWALAGIFIYIIFRFKHFSFALAAVVALFHDVLIALGFMALTKRPIDILSITAFLTIAGYSTNDTIVIYDRVRENSRLLGKMSLKDLINLTVNQTLGRTILTSANTLLVVAAFLFYGGEVLGNFAFALFVGFIAGVYSTIYIASPLLILAYRSKKTFSKR